MPLSAARRACGSARVAACRLALGLCAALLAACGFHLQGAGRLPDALARTYLETDEPASAFTASLREELRRRGAEVVARPEDATSVLRILVDVTDQRVMSVTARNVPREYEIYYQVTFALDAGDQRLLEPQSLVATRVYAWSESEVLGKAAEARVLRDALAEDLARRVMRRIEAFRPSAPRTDS